MKQLGESIIVFGGAETTPHVEVSSCYQPGSHNHGEPTLTITQGKIAVQISPDTLQSILDWYREMDVVVVVSEKPTANHSLSELPMVFGSMLVFDSDDGEI